MHRCKQKHVIERQKLVLERLLQHISCFTWMMRVLNRDHNTLVDSVVVAQFGSARTNEMVNVNVDMYTYIPIARM